MRRLNALTFLSRAFFLGLDFTGLGGKGFPRVMFQDYADGPIQRMRAVDFERRHGVKVERLTAHDQYPRASKESESDRACRLAMRDRAQILAGTFRPLPSPDDRTFPRRPPFNPGRRNLNLDDLL